MRFFFGSILIGVLLSPMATASGSAADRQVFLYGKSDDGGALIHDYANRWVEIVGSSERFGFEEISRTDDTIELLDRGRDVGLRVHADGGELRLMKSTIWHPWQRGKWIKREDLPTSIRFVPTDNQIRLAYFVPADRRTTDRYEQKIRVVMEVVNDLYRTALQDAGYPFAGLNLERNAHGEPIVHLIQTRRTAQYYNDGPAYDQAKHFDRIFNDIPFEVGSARRHMLVVFAETYDPGPAPIEWNGSIGRGGHVSTDGGVGIMSAWILRDEFCALTFEEQKKLILDKTPMTGRTALGTRLPNSPRFEFIEDGFGAVAHELGHALGLPHDHRLPNDMMGNGFRSLQANYLPSPERNKRIAFSRDNARLLSVSRYLFSDVDRTDSIYPTAEVTAEFKERTSPVLDVSLQAADDRALRAVVFFDPQNDSVIGGAELKDRQQAVMTKFPIAKFKSGEFRLITLLADGGGNIASTVTTVTIP